MSETPAKTNEAPDTHHPAPFTVEVMVSAGPRKAPSQYETDPANAELCEDCAGAAWVGDTLLFWLSDGASEAKVLPRLREAEIEAPGPPQGLGFSTRALAKDLGQAFVSQAGGILMKGGEIPPDLPAQAFTGLAMIWQERLDAYLTLLEARGLRERLLAQLPKAGRFDWSATFTGGIFHPVTRCLSTWNCGNAGGLVAAAEPQIIAPTDRYITFQVSLVPEEPLRACLMLSPLTDLAPEHFTNVAGFALVSDGMERYRLEGLLTRLAGIPFAALGDFRLALLKGADLTWDDKSLVFGRFL